MVVPAYNAAATLAEQLEALAAQQYDGDWEVVVVDNGSTDGTADLARRYAARSRRFTLVDGGPRRGHSAPRNAGAKAARGELLAYCDADDVVAPGWLQAMADAACHYDLIGGWLDAPVVVSPMTGAVGTIVHDGVNGIVVDPQGRVGAGRGDAPHRRPGHLARPREGVRRMNPALRPEAATRWC